MTAKEEIREKPNLSILAMVSFIASFSIARTFTSLYPKTIMEISGLHIHHFWYGIAMLAIGGWLGISYESERTDRLAAILFGAGGGLIGDEVGLLLAVSPHEYWAGITYTLVIMFVTFASMLILLNRYRKLVRSEFTDFLRSNASLYFGVFLVSVSIAFIVETDDPTIIAVSGLLTVVACIIILSYFVQRIITRMRRRVATI